MSEHVLVWDIETVPDTTDYINASLQTDLDDERAREELDQKFPKHIYHKIICIGALIASKSSNGWAVRSLGVPNIAERSEPQLIRSFVERINELNPRLVSYNGSGFDLPVLRYRAMKYAISAPGLAQRPYFNRYTEDSLDLLDVLSSFDQKARVTLHELSKVLGFQGKPKDVDGSKVSKLYSENRISDISKYCENDVLDTFRIWLRYELFRGNLTNELYAQSETDLTQFLSSRSV